MNRTWSTNASRGVVPLALLLAALGVGVSCRAVNEATGAGDEAAPAAAETGEPEAPEPVSELTGAFDSPFGLASAILEGIHEGDYERLLEYRVNEAEWVHIVWPELPSSRPGRGLSWDYAWRDLDQKSRNAVRQTIARHESHGYRLLRVEFAGETSDYDTFKVHRDARCVVETAAGEILTLDLFGSVIERRGRFKAFSYVVD